MPALGTVATSAHHAWAYQDRIDAASARFAFAGLLAPSPSGSATPYRSGVFASGDTTSANGPTHTGLQVRPGTGLTPTVEAGHAVVDTPDNGPYMASLGGQELLVLDPASPGMSRIDLVIGRIYDDQNSALGSPVGQRKFTVEVWTGDASSGTPVRPTPTPAAGWIPLAAITVAAGASSLTAANIADLRGPALVARGGATLLYGADSTPGSAALAVRGSHPGDRRWVGRSDQFHDQVYEGSAIGWRGAGNVHRYSPKAVPTDHHFYAGWGAEADFLRFTVPDPGVPYLVYPSARAAITLSNQCAADLVIVIAHPVAQSVSNWVRFDTYGSVTDKLCVPNVAPMHNGPYTGTVDVIVRVGMRDQYNEHNGFVISPENFGIQLSILVMPAASDDGD
jgi:hypothetical protein